MSGFADRLAELAEIRQHPTTTVEKACGLIGIGRTLGYQLAREQGQLCEGVRVIRVGRMLKVPTRPLLAVLGYDDTPTPEVPAVVLGQPAGSGGADTAAAPGPSPGGGGVPEGEGT